MYKRTISKYSIIGKSIAEENMAGYGMLKGNQLNQSKLKVAFPQRVQLPVYFNTPRRDDMLIDYTRYRTKTPQESNSSYIYNKPALEMSCTDSYHRVAATKRIRDFQMLSFACKRSNKLRDEGRAYYSCGVLYDNLGQHSKAISEYQKFLSVCTKIGDTHGESLSYNCIGISYMKLALKDSKYYENAIEYHNKHKAIADIGGKFIAHINLGIAFSSTAENEKAAINFQMALRCAIQMSSKAGQSLAIGNLGKIGYNNTIISDQEKLQMLIQRYIELANYLKDEEGKSTAYLELGKVLMDKKEWATSAKHFEEAIASAKQNKNKEVLENATANYGIAQANLAWEEYSKRIIQSKN